MILNAFLVVIISQGVQEGETKVNVWYTYFQVVLAIFPLKQVPCDK